MTNLTSTIAPTHPHHSNDLHEHQYLHFPTQRPGEHVILLLRRQWMVMLGVVIKLIFLLLLPPVVILLIVLYTTFSITSGTASYVLVIIGLSLYFLFAFLSYFHDFVDYHLDIWVVTDQRIVSIEQQGLFKRVVAELNILRVQDVTSEMKGKIQTFLNFGNVYVQTAGEQERFIFEEVPHPAEVAKIILQVHDKAVRNREMEKIKRQEAYERELDAQLNTHVEVHHTVTNKSSAAAHDQSANKQI